MTKFDLFDSIGNVDDELIEKAKQPKKNSKKAFLAIISVAACAVFACAAVLTVQNMNKNNNIVVYLGVSSAVVTNSVKPVDEKSLENGVTGGSSSEVPVLEDSGETTVEEMSFEIYYVVDGKIEHKTTKTSASAKAVFEVWKNENHVGEEVKLINVNWEQSGIETSEYEYSGVGIADYKSDGKTIYTLKVTKNIENYYVDTDRELLLETLKKTMTGMNEMQIYDYDIVLEEESEQFFEDDEILSDESESNRIDLNDIQYNDQGEILE